MVLYGPQLDIFTFISVQYWITVLFLTPGVVRAVPWPWLDFLQECDGKIDIKFFFFYCVPLFRVLVINPFELKVCVCGASAVACTCVLRLCTRMCQDTSAKTLKHSSLSNLLMTQCLSLGMLYHVAWSLCKLNLFLLLHHQITWSLHIQPTHGGCITLRSMCVWSEELGSSLQWFRIDVLDGHNEKWRRYFQFSALPLCQQ